MTRKELKETMQAQLDIYGREVREIENAGFKSEKVEVLKNIHRGQDTIYRLYFDTVYKGVPQGQIIREFFEFVERFTEIRDEITDMFRYTAVRSEGGNGWSYVHA